MLSGWAACRHARQEQWAGRGGGNDRKKSFVIDPNTIIYICFTTVVVTL